MRFLLKALTRTPLPVLYAVGTFLYVVLFHVVRWRRDQVESDIARAFPEKTPVEQARILRQSYRNIADVVMEAIWGFGASPEAIARRITFENRDVVDAAREAKQSVVLLTPRPGRIARILQVPLPRPRTPEMRLSDDFAHLVAGLNRDLYRMLA